MNRNPEVDLPEPRPSLHVSIRVYRLETMHCRHFRSAYVLEISEQNQQVSKHIYTLYVLIFISVSGRPLIFTSGALCIVRKKKGTSQWCTTTTDLSK